MGETMSEENLPNTPKSLMHCQCSVFAEQNLKALTNYISQL